MQSLYCSGESSAQKQWKLTSKRFRLHLCDSNGYFFSPSSRRKIWLTVGSHWNSYYASRRTRSKAICWKAVGGSSAKEDPRAENAFLSTGCRGDGLWLWGKGGKCHRKESIRTNRPEHVWAVISASDKIVRSTVRGVEAKRWGFKRILILVSFVVSSSSSSPVKNNLVVACGKHREIGINERAFGGYSAIFPYFSSRPGLRAFSHKIRLAVIEVTWRVLFSLQINYLSKVRVTMDDDNILLRISVDPFLVDYEFFIMGGWDPTWIMFTRSVHCLRLLVLI